MSVSGSRSIPAAAGATFQIQLGATPLSPTGTADGLGHYSFGSTVPAATTPGNYVVTVTRLTGAGAPDSNVCPGTVEIRAALAPTATPTPTATPDDDDDDDLDADDLADLLEALADANGGGGGGGQQQQQQQAIPVALPAAGGFDGAKLPKTGVDVAEVGGLGTVSMLAGVSLMEFARRRRRHWLAPARTATASTPAEPDVGPAPAEPFDPITPTF